MVKLRKAHKEDSEFVAKMILMALHIETNGNELFVSHMKELVMCEETLYHWSRVVIAMDDDVPIGMILAYDGSDYHERRVKSFSFVCSDGRPVVDNDTSHYESTGQGGSEPVQQVALLTQPDESGSGEYYIDSLAVLPDCRGRGIGRLLLVEAVRFGQSEGLTPSILVLPDNIPAVKLYESVGFTGNEEMIVFGDCYRKMRVLV